MLVDVGVVAVFSCLFFVAADDDDDYDDDNDVVVVRYAVPSQFENRRESKTNS